MTQRAEAGSWSPQLLYVFRAVRVPTSPCPASARPVRVCEAAAQRPGQLQGQVPAAAQPPAAVRLQQAHHRLAAHPGGQGLITINELNRFSFLSGVWHSTNIEDEH